MEFDIKKQTNLLVVTGSRAYGTYTEHSDIDVRGIATPPKAYFLSFHKKFEQYDERCQPEAYPFWDSIEKYMRSNEINPTAVIGQPLDQSIYALGKFFALAAQCNPNIIELLFSDPQDILYKDEIGSLLIEHKHLFLSAKAKFTFSGYAISQLNRIKTHRKWLLNPVENKPTRADFGLPERPPIPGEHRLAAEKLVDKFIREWLLMEENDLDKRVMENIHLRLGELFAETLRLPNDKHDALPQMVARLCAMNKLGMSKDYIAILQAEKAYRDAKREYSQYQDWKHNRNPDRAKMEAESGFDCKHAMHLVRLMRMAKEILVEGTVRVKRPDAEELKGIRDGAWSYDTLIEWAHKKETELNNIYKENAYVVPKTPNINAVDTLYANCCIMSFNKEN